MRHDRSTCLAIFSSVALLVLGGCKPDPQASGPAAPRRASAPPTAAPAAPVPYIYPAPVKGHYKEINTGDFDVVDGIAYSTEGGTVVLVTEKAIASPVLAGSTCPMTQARALALIRNAAYLEVTIDAAGRSKYFAAGTQYAGQGRSEDVGGHEWKITGGKPADGRIAGSVVYKGQGSFEFDLPVSKPGVNEVSMGERVQGNRFDVTRRAPTQDEVVGSYTAIRGAALKKDLEAMLRAQGFDAKQVAAIRGLPGIDADLAAHADRFMVPGDPEEPDTRPGYGQVGGRGKNSKEKAFSNYYEFAPCGEKLVLVSIGENPQ